MGGDPGADHDGGEERGAERLGEKPSGEWGGFGHDRQSKD